MIRRWLLRLRPSRACLVLAVLAVANAIPIPLLVAEESWDAVGLLAGVVGFVVLGIAIVWVRAVRPGDRWPARA